MDGYLGIDVSKGRLDVLLVRGEKREGQQFTNTTTGYGKLVDWLSRRLKAEQVQRLCGIERTMCLDVLETLVNAKFLCMKADGQYARLTQGRVPPVRSAKAVLRTDTRSTKAS